MRFNFISFKVFCFLAAVSFLFAGNVYSDPSPGNCSCIVRKTVHKINRGCKVVDCADVWDDLHQGSCPPKQRRWPGGAYTSAGCYSSYPSFISGVCKKERYGSSKFQVGDFKKHHLNPKELANAILKDSGEESQGFSSWEGAVGWLNDSILPYKLLINSKLDKNIQELLGQIEKNTGKKLSEFTDDELKKLAKTSEGQKLKRLILRLRYPLKTPKRQKYLKRYLIDCKKVWNDLRQGSCLPGQRRWSVGTYTSPGCYSSYSSFKSRICKKEGYQYEKEGCSIEGLSCTCSCNPACDSSCNCNCIKSDLCSWSEVESCDISGNCVPGCLPTTVGPCDKCAPTHHINCVPYSFHDTFDVIYDDGWTAVCTCTYHGSPCPPPPPSP